MIIFFALYYLVINKFKFFYCLLILFLKFCLRVDSYIHCKFSLLVKLLLMEWVIAVSIILKKCMNM